jgi:GTPase SAR1 family protein
VISWVRELRQFCEKDAVIALVGNKVDLQGASQVTEEMARALSEKTGATHFLTSAKANINVDALVKHMASSK